MPHFVVEMARLLSNETTKASRQPVQTAVVFFTYCQWGVETDETKRCYQGRAVQRCRLAVIESALQHLMDGVRRLIARGIPEPAII